jgi:tetratricopeptide (TPR) repeat protein
MEGPSGVHEMRRFGLNLAVYISVIWLSSTRTAWADQTVDQDDTVTNTTERAPAVKSTDIVVLDQAEYNAMLRSHEGKRYPAIAYLGGEMLGVDPAFVHDSRTGLELIYQRDYKKAMAHWNDMGRKWRGTGIAPVGRVLVWQALMLENFDFRYEKQYKTAWWQARQELEEAMMRPGNDAWEYFMLGGMLGVDSIHLMRKEEFVSSLARGYEAMKAINKCKDLAPEFTDAFLGDGLFNYWATVVSMNTKSIPNTGDNREIGIQQIKKVEQQGIFLRPAATLALTYTWIEEGKRKKALEAALRNKRKYPDNVINNQVLGRVYMYNRMYEESEKIFEGVLEVDAENRRVHFYLGGLYVRWSKDKEAMASLDRYLAFDDLSDTERGGALYYKGKIYFNRRDYALAKPLFEEAWSVSRNKWAKSKLETIEKREESSK